MRPARIGGAVNPACRFPHRALPRWHSQCCVRRADHGGWTRLAPGGQAHAKSRMSTVGACRARVRSGSFPPWGLIDDL